MRVRYDDNWCDEAYSIMAGPYLIEQLNKAGNILITCLDKRYTREECSQYDLIASATTGTDHIDNGDVPLISLKGDTEFLNTIPATAEHTIALMLALMRQIPAAHNDVLRGNWQRESWQGRELRGKTLGIVGNGRVGSQVAHIAKGFGMNPISFKYPVTCLGEEVKWAHLVFLGELARESDIVTVHVPLEGNEGLINHSFFAMMKPGAYFINTSRGAVVCEDALLNALQTGHLAGAALDVVCGEPSDINPRLIDYARTHENLIITPHIAGNTKESRKACQLHIAKKIKQYIEGGT